MSWRVTSKFRERLNSVLRTCLRLAESRDSFTVSDVALELGISERAAREYLEDLRVLGYLEYAGGGYYKLRYSEASRFLKAIEEDPLASATVDLMVPADKALSLMSNRKVFDKVHKLLERIGGWPGDLAKVRYRLLKVSPVDLGLESIIAGDKLLLTSRDYSPFFLHDVVIGGVSTYELKLDYVFRNLFPLSVVFIAAAGEAMKFMLGDYEISWHVWRPRLERFQGSEPFSEDEPFYELASEMPELLEAGRRIAARLLTELTKIKVCRDLIMKINSTKRKYCWIFLDGTLKIHGFVLGNMSHRLRALWEEINSQFEDLVKLAMDCGVRIVGVVNKPYGATLSKAIAEYLNLKGYHASDFHFFSLVLQEGDATVPIRVPEERGKHEPLNFEWYELYWKPREGYPVIRLEFLVKEDEDVMEVTKRLLEVASSLVRVPLDRERSSPELFPLFEVSRKARDHVMKIKDFFELGLRAADKAITEYIRKSISGGDIFA